MSAKVTVIYYSATGNTYKLAKAVTEGAESVGAETRLRRVAEIAPPEAINSRPDWRRHLDETRFIPEATYDDLTWADAYALGSPTRYGTIAAQLKEFIDTTGSLWARGQLAKVGAVFATAQSVHGGQEATCFNLLTVLYHWGCIIVPPDMGDPSFHAFGSNPYGVTATVPEGPDDLLAQAALDAAKALGKRVATVADWVISGRLVGARA